MMIHSVLFYIFFMVRMTSKSDDLFFFLFKIPKNPVLLLQKIRISEKNKRRSTFSRASYPVKLRLLVGKQAQNFE